jgi:hypothetical protein
LFAFHLKDHRNAVALPQGPKEIAYDFRKLFHVPYLPKFLIQEVSEVEYRWGLEDKPAQDPRKPISYQIILWSKRHDIVTEEGNADFLGEWLSRGINVMTPHFEPCTITKDKSGRYVTISDSVEPNPLFGKMDNLRELPQKLQFPYD